ncbi:eCIS core domain-containing protein [Tenacibaculum agarivorans]|uniref:eCIS core domain-containing protein n=1 Tax=Tenacibaculum agarivorans TaxID=1908389 RepID=UPI0009FA8E6D|nr:DUF4157 domain-containing protein [Tenacibaculum agarivorans]
MKFKTNDKLDKSNSISSVQNIGQKKEIFKGSYLSDNRTKDSIQKKPNNTGLPDNLKSGIENMSGYSMDDVKVHYNSNKPAQLNAHAYAQGTDIHVASGQEQHVPHEAWHVVQQKQGRVQPTTSVNGSQVNDNAGLETEADVMGAKALQMKVKQVPLQNQNIITNKVAQLSPDSARLEMKKWFNKAMKFKSSKLEEFKGDKEAYTSKYGNKLVEIAEGLMKYLNYSKERYALGDQREVLKFVDTKADEFLHVEGNEEEDNEFKQLIEEIKTIAITELEGTSGDEIMAGNLEIPEDAPIESFKDTDLLSKGEDKEVSLAHLDLEGERLLEGTGALEYKGIATRSPLFVGTPTIADVRQGNLGDCYLLAALISIVKTNPDFIKDMMRDNGNGTVTVKLFDIDTKVTPAESGKGSTVDYSFIPRYINVRKSVIVDKGVYEKNENDHKENVKAKQEKYSEEVGDDDFKEPRKPEVMPKYARGGVWVQMIEKAYAAAGYGFNNDDESKTSYEKISGGFGEATLQYLLGKESDEVILPNKKTADDTVKGLMEDLNMGNIVLDVEFELEDIIEEMKDGSSIEDEGESEATDMSKSQTLIDLENTLEKFLKIFKSKEKLEVEPTVGVINDLKNSVLSRFGDNQDMTEKVNKLFDTTVKELNLQGYGVEQGVYTPKQIEFYKKITKDLGEGKNIILQTKSDFIGERTEDKDKEGEGGEGVPIKGMYKKHAYAVIATASTISEDFANNERLYLMLANPHAKDTPIYSGKVDEKGIPERRMSTKEEDDINEGIFKYDLADIQGEVNSIVIA